MRPIIDKSRLMNKPTAPIAPNTPAVMKNVCAIEPISNTKKMEEKKTPFNKA